MTSTLESPFKGKVILVVDDDFELRRAMIFDFKKKGCSIFEAANGADALVIVRNNSIDIVVSDVRMPNGSGIELLLEIQKISPKTPIVLLATGFADLSEPEAKKMGAFALIEKPINRKNMFAILEQSLLTSNSFKLL